MRTTASYCPILGLFLATSIGSLQSACMGACDILDYDTKELSGGYCLGFTSEFNKYVVAPCDRRSKFGVFDSPVTKIGWTDRYIVAWRVDWNRTKAGWMVLDLRRHAVAGTLDEQAFADLRARKPAVGNIVIHAVSDVLR